MSASNEHTQATTHNVTRRNLFRMAVGSFATLPAVAGGFLVKTQPAYADESGKVSQETDGGEVENPTTKIEVVRGYELGVNVVDTATGGEDPIAGAHVRIVSRYNGKEVSDYTHDDGIVKIDIRDLAEDLDGVGADNLNVYAFNGTITVDCPGYREFEMALTRLTGGGGVTVSTRNLSEGADDPYPRLVSFNEWDVLYATDNEFCTTTKNDAEQNLSLEFRQMPAGEATVMLKERGSGKTLLSTTSTVGDDGVLKASFVGKLLQAGTEDALPEKKPFDVEVVQGENHTLCPIKLAVKHGVSEEQAKTDKYKTTPIDVSLTNTTMAHIKWPDGVPIVGGGEIKGFSPDFYVNAYYNPLGYFQLTVKTPSIGYMRDSGHNADDNGQGWQTFPTKFPSDWWNNGIEQIESGLSRAKEGYQNWDEGYLGRMTAGDIKPIDCFASIKVSENLQLVAIAKWNSETRLFQGMAAGQLFLSVITSVSANFWLGIVPVLISFDFNFTSVITLGAGFYTENGPGPDAPYDPSEAILNPGNWKWDYSNTGLTITINLIPSLSVGVGVRGIGSVSVRGSFQLTLTFGLTYKGSMSSDIYELPHFIGGYAASISLVISMFFFTTTFTLKKWKYREFADNWKKNKNLMEAFADEASEDWRRSSEDLTMEDIIGRLEIIDDATLGRTSEIEGKALRGQADSKPFNWESVRKQDRTVRLDNGHEITYAVYSMKTQDIVEQSALVGQSEDDAQVGTMPSADEAAQDAPVVSADGLTASDEVVMDNQLDAQEETVAADEGTVVDDATADDAIVSDETTAQGEVVAVEEATSEPSAEQREEEGEAAAEAQEQEVFVPRRKSSVDYGLPSGEAFLTAMADSDAVSPLAPMPRAIDVSNHGGIILHPDTDKIIAGNTSGDPKKTPYVFGDPRMKVAAISTNIGGSNLRVTCSFRVGVVTINDQRRSRVMMTVIDAESGDGSDDAAAKRYIGFNKPLDFEFMDLKGIEHADLYDYEFDIVFTTVQTAAGSIDMVHLVVVSGVREFDDATSIVDASTDLVFSYVNFRASDAFGDTSYLVKSVSAMTVLGNGNYDDRYHCISNVRIGTDGTEESWRLLIGMLDRSSDEADKVLTDDYGDGTNGTVKTSVVFAILDQRAEEWLVPERGDIEDAMAITEIENGTILGMTISPMIQGAYTVTLTSTEETFFFVVKFNEDLAVFKSIKMAPMLESGMRLVPWPQQDCFLTTYPSHEYLEELNESGEWKHPEDWDRSKWMLQKAWWEEELDNPADPESGTPILHFEPIGPDNFNIDTFGINSSGTFIYWPQGREGNEGRIYDDEGNYEPLDEEDTHLYQLMAARVYKGYFSDPFVVAEVDHNMSDLVVVASRDNRSPLEVLSVEHVQSGIDNEGNPVYLHHEANVWYTAVPHVVCATVVDCYAPVPFVSAGGQIVFSVTIRNDGNCYLKGCTLQLCLHDTTTNEKGETVASTSAVRVDGSVAKLWIGEETLLESHFNPRNSDTGELENVEVDFTLAPGKRSVYSIRMPIPEDWEEGVKYVSLVASVNKDEDVAEGGSLAAMSDDGGIIYQEFGVEPGEYRPYLQRSTPDVDKNRTHMDVITVDADSTLTAKLADAPLTHWTDDSGYNPYDPGQPGQSGGSSSGQPSGSSQGGSSTTTTNVPGPGSKVPSTGDPISGVAAGVVAAAGAALTAYGIRRARNENARNEEA